jgi:uncharacterized phiE125 gp8 family phage protein
MWDRLAFKSGGGAVMTLDEAKAHLRVDSTDSDDLITALIGAAQAAIEGPRGIGVALLTQVWELRLDGWPVYEIRIPLGPASLVNSIKYRDLANVQQTLDPAQYVYDLAYDPLVIRRSYGAYWPPALPQPGAVVINFNCGFGDDASAIPLDLKQAMLLLVGHFYEHREAVVGVDNRDSSAELPLGVSAILERYRAGRIS